MVIGVGIGTPLSINGTAALAFAHILYKSLFFMVAGAILFRAGTCRSSQLGGLYKSMPWTTAFCIIAAASLSAPLFCGFVTKSLILSAVANKSLILPEEAKAHHTNIWLLLVFASAAIFFHTGLKLPFVAFFQRQTGNNEDKSRIITEAPRNMLIAMGIAAAICVFIGVFPAVLYRHLPYHETETVYDATHVITQLQLLLWSALAFTFLQRTGIYPREMRSVNLDTDWVYRRAIPVVVTFCRNTGSVLCESMTRQLNSVLAGTLSFIRTMHQPQGIFGRTLSIGSMVIWAAVLLVTYLLLYYA
jgi:multicomponent Na+:H+ antiporter subunit D